MAYRQFSTAMTMWNSHALKSNAILAKSFFKCMSSSATAGKSLNVGFVGLGNMGARMANNLIQKGHKVNAFDIVPAACDEAGCKGCGICRSAEEVAQKSDYVITMLPNNDIVMDTYEKMVQNGVKPTTMFIDSSTIDPNVAKKVQKLVKSKGASFVDAPVSGGVIGAENATLTFMVGGSETEYNTVKGLLECMGQRITHCGDYGMGQAAKLCNNMMLGISMIGVCETMNLAVRLGLDPKTFCDIINSSTGRCWSSEIYNPVPGMSPNAPANNDYKGGFSTALITKDLGLASGIATASNSPIPMGAIAHQIYRTLQCQGLGDKDFSYVYEFLKNQTPKKVCDKKICCNFPDHKSSLTGELPMKLLNVTNSMFERNAVKIFTEVQISLLCRRMYSKRSHYDVLNVRKNCSTDDIRLSFAKLSKKYHPDTSKTGSHEQNARKFQEIMEAYRVLSKKSTRDAYDIENSPDHYAYPHYATPFKRQRERRFYEGDFASWQQHMHNQRSGYYRTNGSPPPGSIYDFSPARLFNKKTVYSFFAIFILLNFFVVYSTYMLSKRNKMLADFEGRRTRQILYEMPRHGTYASHSSHFERQHEYEQQMHELSRDRMQQQKEHGQPESQSVVAEKSIPKDE